MSNVTNKKAVFMLALSEIRYKTLGQNGFVDKDLAPA